jgi:hypothetical protein
MKITAILLVLMWSLGCASKQTFPSEILTSRFAITVDCSTDRGELARNPLYCNEVLRDVITDLRKLGLIVFDVAETDPPGKQTGRLQEEAITHALYVSVHPGGIVNNVGVVSGSIYTYQTGDLPISCSVYEVNTKELVAMNTINAFNRHHDAMMGRLSRGAHQSSPNYKGAASSACKKAIVDLGRVYSARKASISK